MRERSEPARPSAEAVRDLWEAELELESPATTQTSEETRLETLMQNAPIPIINSPPERTWIWSDLHLGDMASITAFDRSFRTPQEMDQAMMDAWYELVDVDDTIICLGDVSVDGSILAHHQEWWREAPGATWLVLGNHDVAPVNQMRPLEVDRTAVTMAAPGDPPLLLTHVPLLQVPTGWVNVHGHVHQKESPSRNRHINVSAKQLDYRPAKMSDIRRLARRLLEGRTVPATEHQGRG